MVLRSQEFDMFYRSCSSVKYLKSFIFPAIETDKKILLVEKLLRRSESVRIFVPNQITVEKYIFLYHAAPHFVETANKLPGIYNGWWLPVNNTKSKKIFASICQQNENNAGEPLLTANSDPGLSSNSGSDMEDAEDEVRPYFTDSSSMSRCVSRF